VKLLGGFKKVSLVDMRIGDYEPDIPDCMLRILQFSRHITGCLNARMVRSFGWWGRGENDLGFRRPVHTLIEGQGSSKTSCVPNLFLHFKVRVYQLHFTSISIKSYIIQAMENAQSTTASLLGR